MKTCNIHINGKVVGQISESSKGCHFEYDPDWVQNGGTPISTSLPLNNSFSDRTATDFFVNLLPEGARLAKIAAMTRIRFSDLVRWLDAYGEDLPGNLSIYQKGYLKKSQNITKRIENLVENGHSLDLLRERLSLAGIESKTAVIAKNTKNRWDFFSPTASMPSTHILKQASEICILEAMTMQMLTMAKIYAVRTELIPVAGIPILLVNRYDREFVEGKWQKIAQEDFCQFLGRPNEDKYWFGPEQGGINNQDMVKVLDMLPYEDKIEFLRMSCASLILGNTDDHAKNYSVIHYPNGTRLAPAYDVTSVVGAQKWIEACRYISPRLARPFGNHIQPSQIVPDDVIVHAQTYGIEPKEYLDLWHEVNQSIKESIKPAVDFVVADAEQKDFLPRQLLKIKNFGMLLSRLAENRVKRFAKLVNSTLKQMQEQFFIHPMP